MTVPYERTRAVIQAREFLEQLERDSNQNEATRSMVTQLLWHYPSRGEVLLQGRVQEWLGRRFGFEPFFSSKITRD